MNTSSRVYSYAQRGMATLAILILVGFAVSVAVFGALRFLQGSQSQTTAYHSQTQAQMRAWSGVDMLFQYFSGLNSLSSPPTFDSLTSALNSARTSGSNLLASATNLEAFVQTVQSANNEAQVTINVTGISELGSKAEARSTIQAVYVITLTSKNNQGTTDDRLHLINIYTDLDRISGRADIKNSDGEPVVMNVVGNVNANEIMSLDVLNVTGNVSLRNDSVKVRNLYSDGDVTIDGVKSLNLINTKKSIKVKNYSANILLAGANVDFGDGDLNQYVYANGSINLNQNGTLHKSSGDSDGVQVKSGNNLNCGGNRSNYKNIESYSFTNCNSAGQNQKQVKLESSGNVIDESKLGTSLNRETPLVNALCFDPSLSLNCQSNSIFRSGDSANYIFDYINNKIVVTVYNVNGFVDGSSYCLGSNKGNSSNGPSNLTANDHWGYLYKAVVSSSNVSCGNEVKANIARWYATHDSKLSITYNSGGWNLKKQNFNAQDSISYINKPALAPGVILFKGNLDLGEGVFNNSIIATGNIKGEGNNTLIHAPNYAGARAGVKSAVCNVESELNSGLDPLNGYFPSPKNLCKNESEMTDIALGDIALLAGSYIGSYDKLSYKGGDIFMKTNLTIYGNLIAGNLSSTSGQVKLYGFLGVLGLGNTNKKFTMTDLTITLPKTNHKNIGAPIDNSDTGSINTEGSVSIKWVRYI